MVSVARTETIACRPQEFLEFVMDIERYAEVDEKIKPILWSRRDGNLVEFACRPKLAGLRQPKVVQQVRLTSDRRIDISLSPLPANRLAHRMAHFEASFECETVAAGTKVMRCLEFRFNPLLRWLLEPLFRHSLPAQVSDELMLAKQHFAAAQPPSDKKAEA